MGLASRGERLDRVALGEDVELEAVGHAELVVDAAQVVAQGVLADVQPPREPPVVRSGVGDQLPDDVALARGQRGDAAVFGVGRSAALAAGELDEDAPGGRAVGVDQLLEAPKHAAVIVDQHDADRFDLLQDSPLCDVPPRGRGFTSIKRWSKVPAAWKRNGGAACRRSSSATNRSTHAWWR